MDNHQPGSQTQLGCKKATAAQASASIVSPQQLVQITQPSSGDGLDWKTLEQLRSFPGGQVELSSRAVTTTEKLAQTSRRDFLAMMGFTMAAAGLAGCRAPVQNALPLLTGSDDIIPGVANYYATTCGGCSSSCSLVVKQRDGRPIKIEGNTGSTIFGGGTCATGQATVLSLYDDARLREPMWMGKPAYWEDVDRQVLQFLRRYEPRDLRIALLTSTLTSPSTRAIVADWQQRYPKFKHVSWDSISYSALLDASYKSFGQRAIPHYRFDKARVIVALDADFLGTWLSPVEFARQYAKARKTEAGRVLHVQIEPGFSVTGSNADVRLAVASSQMMPVAAALLARVAIKAGYLNLPDISTPVDVRQLDAIADELWKHRGESLVVSGVNDLLLQTTVNTLNLLLRNIDQTVELNSPSLQRSGTDVAMHNLIGEMERGDVHAIMLYGVNPAYDFPDQERFVAALKQVPLSISFSDRLDETSSQVHAICPDHHFLESWGDAEPVESHFSLSQPLIAPLFGTRAAQDSLLAWLDVLPPSYYSYLREFWRKNVFPRHKERLDFEAFWEQSLRDGVSVASSSVTRPTRVHEDWKSAVRTILENVEKSPSPMRDDYELQLYESVAMRDGRHANNPWLQELPDPVSKITWGNYAAVAPALAKNLGIRDGDVVRVKSKRGQLELPAFVQPGQEPRTISIALGYGRTHAGKAGNNVGVNVSPLVESMDGTRSYALQQIGVEKTGRSQRLASTQSDMSMEGRPLVLETTLQEMAETEHNDQEDLPNIWAERLIGEHSWGMAIDLNACTGCSACVVACQAENNVPVVGVSEVTRNRIMHWVRLDRYYAGSEDNPRSIHQPMMCQHCQHAPCETVCPVLATTTSSEGLNQQVYNRCIGTRYCANNCPYKVRRFNWFQYSQNPEYDYTMESDLGRMVLNPDVAVRSRGVIEKCSMCIQRIQLAKNMALQGRRDLADGDIQTACQQVCPTQAITFGDLKDPESRVSKMLRDQRRFQVLAELGVKPNVSYLKKIRNTLETT